MRNFLTILTVLGVTLAGCGGDETQNADAGKTTTAETSPDEPSPSPGSSSWEIMGETQVDSNQTNVYAVATTPDVDLAAAAESCANAGKTAENERYCWLFRTRQDFEHAQVDLAAGSMDRLCWAARAGAGVGTDDVGAGTLTDEITMGPTCPSYSTLFPEAAERAAEESEAEMADPEPSLPGVTLDQVFSIARGEGLTCDPDSAGNADPPVQGWVCRSPTSQETGGDVHVYGYSEDEIVEVMVVDQNYYGESVEPAIAAAFALNLDYPGAQPQQAVEWIYSAGEGPEGRCFGGVNFSVRNMQGFGIYELGIVPEDSSSAAYAAC